MNARSVGLMKEKDQYYSYYEKLMRIAPQAAIEETPEYHALAARYPYLSKSIKLGKELERLRRELKSTKERSTRLQIHSQVKSFVRELKRQNIVKHLHGESKRETDYRRRFSIAAASQWLASMAQRVRAALFAALLELQNKLEEQSRKARLSRASKFPPSLFDLRSLDPVDRGSALREWVEKRRSGIRVRYSAGSVETTDTGVS